MECVVYQLFDATKERNRSKYSHKMCRRHMVTECTDYEICHFNQCNVYLTQPGAAMPCCRKDTVLSNSVNQYGEVENLDSTRAKRGNRFKWADSENLWDTLIKVPTILKKRWLITAHETNTFSETRSNLFCPKEVSHCYKSTTKFRKVNIFFRRYKLWKMWETEKNGKCLHNPKTYSFQHSVLIPAVELNQETYYQDNESFLSFLSRNWIYVADGTQRER